MALAETVRDTLGPHSLPPDALSELTSILSEEAESLGSASDVHDAVGHLLPPDCAVTLSESLFEALKAKRGPGRGRLPAWAEPAGAGPSAEASESGQNESAMTRLSWAREYKSQKERFEQPYVYALPGGATLTLEQRPFDAEGFASTVWDSAIVVAKALEMPTNDVFGHHEILSGGDFEVAGVAFHDQHFDALGFQDPRVVGLRQ